MNKLSFKYKIILSISVMFLLLIMPSRTTFMSYFSKKDTFDTQLIGVEYAKYSHKLVYDIALHRGYSNAYKNGDKSFKSKIIENEKVIKNDFLDFMEFDKNKFSELKKNKQFLDALSQIDIISFKNFSLHPEFN